MCVVVRPVIFAAAVAGTAHLLAPAWSSAQQDPATVSAPRIIEVIARKFEFEPARIEVTEGDHVRLVIWSDDGVHGVAIKRFKVARLVPRGRERVTIESPGPVAKTIRSGAARLDSSQPPTSMPAMPARISARIVFWALWLIVAWVLGGSSG